MAEVAVRERKRVAGPGRPTNENKEKSYDVHATSRIDGRIVTRVVCSLPARGKKQAETKAQNFCTAFGYDYSHVVSEF